MSLGVTAVKHCCEAVLHSSTPTENRSLFRYAVNRHRCTAELFRAKCIPQCSCFLQIAHSRHYVTAVTPMEICSSNSFAVNRHQCIAALFRAKCIPLYSVLLWKTQFIAGSVSLHLHLWRFGVNAGVQSLSTNVLQHCSGQNAFPTVQCCASMLCSFALGKMYFVLFGVAEQHRLTACLCLPAITPLKSLVFTQVCSDLLHQHLCSAALPWAKCISCCSVLCCKQAHSRLVTQHLCSAALLWTKCISNCSMLFCKTGSQHACVALQSHLWRFGIHAGVQSLSTNALQHCSGQHAFPTVQCCAATQAHSVLVSLQLHFCRVGFRAGAP